MEYVGVGWLTLLQISLHSSLSGFFLVPSALVAKMVNIRGLYFLFFFAVPFLFSSSPPLPNLSSLAPAAAVHISWFI